MIKKVLSNGYNYIFNTVDGFFARWGKTIMDDPEYSPLGPEILDIEVSEVCTHGCTFCYKANTKVGGNMTFDQYKTILDKMPSNLCQVAFGIGDIDGNPDLFKMFEYTRSKNIVPNLTIHGKGCTEEYAKLFAKYLGAIAVSWYNEENALNAITLLSEAGLKAINIHFMLSNETISDAYKLINNFANYPVLKHVTALVFLSLKQKGRGIGYSPVTQQDFTDLINYAKDKSIPLGFDSCSAFKVETALPHEVYKILIESCESTLFSSYINWKGEFYPCSFTEGEDNWKSGIDVLNATTDFLKDVWNNDRVLEFRKTCLQCQKDKQNCPANFNI